MTPLSRDAMKLNEKPLLAALSTYGDVLRSRALSLLRRLAALRSRMHLQATLLETFVEVAGMGVRTCKSTMLEGLLTSHSIEDQKIFVHSAAHKATHS